MDNQDKEKEAKHDSLLQKVKGGLLTARLAIFKEAQKGVAPPNRAQRRARAKKARKGAKHAAY